MLQPLTNKGLRCLTVNNPQSRKSWELTRCISQGRPCATEQGMKKRRNLDFALPFQCKPRKPSGKRLTH